MKLNTNYKIIFLIHSSEEKDKRRPTYQYLIFLFISQTVITINNIIIFPLIHVCIIINIIEFQC